MKYSFLLFVFTILLLTACTPVKYLKETTTEDKKVMKTFLTDLEDVAINKHYTLLMDFMDPEYLKEQHEGMLNGNDLQFINEVFCGKDINDQTFHCIEQKDITYFKAKEITQIEDTKYKALFIVGNATQKVACKLLISKKIEDTQVKFGLVGAMG